MLRLVKPEVPEVADAELTTEAAGGAGGTPGSLTLGDGGSTNVPNLLLPDQQEVILLDHASSQRSGIPSCHMSLSCSIQFGDLKNSGRASSIRAMIL